MNAKRFLVLVLISVVLLSLLAICKAAPTNPEVTLSIRSAAFGGSAYVFGVAMEQVINKARHPWLRASSQETLGGGDNVWSVEKIVPAKRRSTIFVAGESTYYLAINGLKPFKRSYKEDMRGFAYMGGKAIFLFTLNPNIKTIDDLVGKKIGFPPRKHSISLRMEHFFDKVWKIRDKVDIQYLGFTGLAEALRDGLIDVGIGGGYVFPKPLPMPHMVELMETKTIYIIPVPKSDVDALTKILGTVVCGWEQMPAGAWGPGQPEPTGATFNRTSCWWCWKDADEKVMYEAIKVLGEHLKDFQQYVPGHNPPLKEQLGSLPVESEKHMHPGVLKYYKEQGIKIGL